MEEKSVDPQIEFLRIPEKTIYTKKLFSTNYSVTTRNKKKRMKHYYHPKGQIIMHFLFETCIWTHKGNTQVIQQKGSLHTLFFFIAQLPVSWFTCSVSNVLVQPISRQGPTLSIPTDQASQSAGANPQLSAKQLRS